MYTDWPENGQPVNVTKEEALGGCLGGRVWCYRAEGVRLIQDASISLHGSGAYVDEAAHPC
jgi:hypothetical protein